MHAVIFFISIGGYHAARLRATYQECQRRGWRMTALQAITSTPQHPWGRLERDDYPVKTLLDSTDSLRMNEQQWFATSAALMPAYLDDLKPDVVAIPGWGYPPSRVALSWCCRRGAAAILMSESKHDDERRFWLKEQLKSWLYVRKFDAALVGSNLHRDYLIKLGLPPERIFLGYDAVDNGYFARQAENARIDPIAARVRQPLIPPRPYFLAATRLITRKNILRLIKAYAAYRQNIGEMGAWDLVVCGSGEEERHIRQSIHANKLDAVVHLPGFVSYDTIGDWYGLASAFIHPALQEQWGLVINEACAAGLPILCSRTVGAGYDLVRHEHNGLLFDPYSVESITDSMISMHRMDKSKRSSMGKISQHIVADFSPQHFAEGLVKAASIAVD